VFEEGYPTGCPAGLLAKVFLLAMVDDVRQDDLNKP
jgi:hypothetical protein